MCNAHAERSCSGCIRTKTPRCIHSRHSQPRQRRAHRLSPCGTQVCRRSRDSSHPEHHTRSGSSTSSPILLSTPAAQGCVRRRCRPRTQSDCAFCAFPYQPAHANTLCSTCLAAPCHGCFFGRGFSLADSCQSYRPAAGQAQVVSSSTMPDPDLLDAWPWALAMTSACTLSAKVWCIALEVDPERRSCASAAAPLFNASLVLGAYPHELIMQLQ
jgi:hypothetical protein